MHVCTFPLAQASQLVISLSWMVASQQYGDPLVVASAAFSVVSILAGLFQLFIQSRVGCRSNATAATNKELTAVITDLRAEIEVLKRQSRAPEQTE